MSINYASIRRLSRPDDEIISKTFGVLPFWPAFKTVLVLLNVAIFFFFEK